jgi:hypothetical protein
MENVAEFSVYLQLKDAAQLALKKMPSSEQEALSLVCDVPFLYILFGTVLNIPSSFSILIIIITVLLWLD